jgi:ornithine--oxo-acid transaminase
MRHGVLTKDTHHTVIRFAPPLIVARAQVDEAVAALRAVLSDLGTDLRNAA